MREFESLRGYHVDLDVGVLRVSYAVQRIDRKLTLVRPRAAVPTRNPNSVGRRRDFDPSVEGLFRNERAVSSTVDIDDFARDEACARRQQPHNSCGHVVFVPESP